MNDEFDDDALDEAPHLSGFDHFPDQDNARQQVVEAALFAAGRPLTVDELRGLFGEDLPVSGREIQAILQRLEAQNGERGIELVKVARGYRYQTKKGLHPWLSRLWEERPKKYSRALLETLALIAYRQPITRGEIEDVRGVSVASNIVRTLLEREWVKVVGHRDVPGRPALFATTQTFLDYFGLASLDDLPPLSEIKTMAELEPELEFDEIDEAEKEVSFSAMLTRLKEEEAAEADHALDEELNEHWQTLDELNEQFEHSLRPPAEDTENAAEDETPENEPESDLVSAPAAETEKREAALTEAEQLAIIQQKLAQQAGLLEQKNTDDDGRE
ncbi:SMC-Scp complex subunit ScpB [Salinispirillum sp. LH 10-3-1]|uniref:SMC-Scp complex subunit ScpB n=1 Tax=Salinispirillum sp. LH 10-3-1 TaxID=2952525 RepID=A0AB38YBR5_9GAMM